MAAGKGYDHVSVGLEYPRGGLSEIDCDPEGQSRGYDMTSFKTMYCHIAGMLALSCWNSKIVSNSLINLQDIWVKDFISIPLAFLLCKLNKLYTKPREVIFLIA